MPKPVTPPLAADIIIEMVDRPDRPIVFIERKNIPHGWALPGGFVDVGETVEQAAVREALEETALHVTLKALLGCYSKPDRDPRGQTVSLVYIAEASGMPQAQDDARDFVIQPPQTPPTPLVFDHPQIVKDYLAWRNGALANDIFLRNM